jgi:hypothetical protein
VGGSQNILFAARDGSINQRQAILFFDKVAVDRKYTRKAGELVQVSSMSSDTHKKLLECK